MLDYGRVPGITAVCGGLQLCAGITALCRVLPLRAGDYSFVLGLWPRTEYYRLTRGSIQCLLLSVRIMALQVSLSYFKFRGRNF